MCQKEGNVAADGILCEILVKKHFLCVTDVEILKQTDRVIYVQMIKIHRSFSSVTLIIELSFIYYINQFISV